MEVAAREPLAAILLAWYALHGRELPWRETHDPYRIWLSEVILQQTRVAQGMAYYDRFTQRFPDVAALAAAPEDEVLKCWQGLGYYSRARNLHAAAQQVVAQFGGIFPKDYADVRSLRGVGDYTAAAICSFAYDKPCAVVDGNVFRVLARLFDIPTPIDTLTGRREFTELAQSLLDPTHAAACNQAMMDFGATCCTPTAPQCAACPFSERCLALAAGSVAQRPVKQGRTKVRDRWFNYLHITCGEKVLLQRRDEKDIWQGLYEFPLIETTAAVELEQLARQPRFRELLCDTDWRLDGRVVMPKHVLSHQIIHATFYRIEVERLTPSAEKWAVDAASLGERAVSRLTERYLTR